MASSSTLITDRMAAQELSSVLRQVWMDRSLPAELLDLFTSTLAPALGHRDLSLDDFSKKACEPVVLACFGGSAASELDPDRNG